jgi:hypothetical protein
MAVTAQAGIFGFGPQGAMEEIATDFYRHKATLIDLGVMDDIRLGALEVGGGPFPTFPYKAGYLVGGGVELQPRLESSLGWLLYATLGDVSTGSPTNGVYPHSFKPLAADLSFVRWLSLKKYVPKKENDALTDIGEIYTDCKPVGLTLTLTNDAPITARWDFIGREFELDNAADGWTWENTYEDWGSIPVGCEVGGYIKFTGGGLTDEELPVVGARVTFRNQNLDIRQEKVYGSPALEDITILQRMITFDCTIKWNNPRLYKAVLTGDVNGSTWSSSPMTGSLNIAMVGTQLAGSSPTQKYELDITAPEIMWQMNAPIQLAGGQAVTMSFTGTALETNSDYATFLLKNDTASYAWPVPSSGS